MVGTWHQRTFPYPLLATWTGDYQGCEFGLSEPRATLRNGNLIEVHLDFRLTSEVLGDLIDKGDAQYVVEVACPKTFTRFTRAVSAEIRLELGGRRLRRGVVPDASDCILGATGGFHYR